MKWTFKLISEPFGVELPMQQYIMNHLGLIFNHLGLSCYAAVYIDSSSKHDVTDIVDRIPIFYAPRQPRRRYRRNQETLGPVINQKLRNR